MFLKKIPLHLQIIGAMVLGVAWGLIAINTGAGTFTTHWIKPFGIIFISMLKMIAVPLIVASLIKGVSSLSDISRLSRIGGKTVVIYMVTTVVAITIGLTFANIVAPGKAFPPEKTAQLRAQYAGNAQEKKQTAEQVQSAGPLQFLVDIVPTNIINSAEDNRNMLQVIFFALLFGIAIVLLPHEKTSTVKHFFDGANEIVVKIVELIMKVAPFGVFALLASIFVDITGDDPSGAWAVLKALVAYSLTVVGGLLAMSLLIYPAMLNIFTKVNAVAFFKGILPAQMLAFSTSSSAATLPVTMDRCEKHLGVSKEVSSFVLPLGATINMDGTSLYQAVAAVFIAQAFGQDLTMANQLTIVLTATLASIGAAAVPGAGMVMLVIVLGSIGIDPEGIALIFATDRILDMCRTAVNITGDSTVATIVASTEGQLFPPTAGGEAVPAEGKASH